MTDMRVQTPVFQSVLIRLSCVPSPLHLSLDPGDCHWGVTAPGWDSLRFLLLLGKAVGFQKCGTKGHHSCVCKLFVQMRGIKTQRLKVWIMKKLHFSVDVFS